MSQCQPGQHKDSRKKLLRKVAAREVWPAEVHQDRAGDPRDQAHEKHAPVSNRAGSPSLKQASLRKIIRNQEELRAKDPESEIDEPASRAKIASETLTRSQ